MYSAYTLNKQWQYTAFLYSFPNIEPVYCSMFSSNCFFLTCIQVSQETGRMVWYSCPLQNFPQIFVIHAVNAFHIVNEADALLEFPCFLYDRVNVGNLISISSAFSKPSLYIWKFPVHILLKDFEHNLTSMQNECNCMVVWTFLGMALPWHCNENWPFPVLWPLLSFPNLLAYWVQHFNSISF